MLDARDIDAISLCVRQGCGQLAFDSNYDRAVNRDDRTYWVRDLRRTWFGDANLDGEFNSQDLVSVFQTGEYEDAMAGNSTWATGDWNGDGEFDSSDFVAAFQDGGYERGPRAALPAVPEPSTFVLITCALLGLVPRGRSRRRATTV